MHFNPNIFSTARLRLTFWYTAFFMLFLGVLSYGFYARTTFALERETDRINRRLSAVDRDQFQNRPVPPEPFSELLISDDDITEAKQSIAFNLLWINTALALVVSLGSYFLAGKTLEPIEKMLEQQQAFIDNASHQLRTPIAALKVSTEVALLKKKVSAETKKILEKNLEELIQLEKLSNQLLHFNNNYTENKETVSLTGTVKKAVALIKPLANKKKIKLIINDSHNQHIEADETKLIELWTILLENAIRYSPDSSKVIVTVTKINNKLSVAVADQGPGLSDEDKQHMFERFYRGTANKAALEHSGTGLGLALAREIAQAYNARISVADNNPRGSIFTVFFS